MRRTVMPLTGADQSGVRDRVVTVMTDLQAIARRVLLPQADRLARSDSVKAIFMLGGGPQAHEVWREIALA
jgi:hypothetical protein